MPIIEDDDMVDRGILWAAAGVDGDGQHVFDEPEEIWLNLRVRRSESISPDGSRLSLDGQASLLESVPIGSLIWVAPDHTTSALTQWYASGSAGQTDEVFQVVQEGWVYDAKAIEKRYTAGLQWYRDV